MYTLIISDRPSTEDAVCPKGLLPYVLQFAEDGRSWGMSGHIGCPGLLHIGPNMFRIV